MKSPLGVLRRPCAAVISAKMKHAPHSNETRASGQSTLPGVLLFDYDRFDRRGIRTLDGFLNWKKFTRPSITADLKSNRNFRHTRLNDFNTMRA